MELDDKRYIWWKYAPRAGEPDKPTKLPVDTRGIAIRWTDSNHWMSYSAALKGCNEERRLGYVLQGSKYVCVDFDCPPDDDRLPGLFAKFNTYTENSPSGKWHAIFEVDGIKEAEDAGTKVACKVQDPRNPEKSFYEFLRGYVTYAGTGMGTVRKVSMAQLQGMKDAIHTAAGIPLEVIGSKPSKPVDTHVTTTPSAFKSDEVVIADCSMKADWRALSQGNDSAYSGDTSAADQAFMNITMSISRDEAQTKRIFMQYRSRDKVNARPDYVDMTLEKAGDVLGTTPQVKVVSGVVETKSEPLPQKVHDNYSESTDEDPVLIVGFPHDNLLWRYCNHGRTVMDSYEAYHLCGAMVMISHLVKAQYSIGDEPLRNNIWFFIVGPTTISGKTYSLRLLRRLAKRLKVIPFAVPGSAEGFFQELATIPLAMMFVNEASKLLITMRAKYGDKLADYMNDAYDNIGVSKGLSRDKEGKGGAVYIEETHFSCLCNTTPTHVTKFAEEMDFSGGLLARALFVAPMYDKMLLEDVANTPEIMKEFEDIASDIESLVVGVSGRTVTFTPNAILTKYRFERRQKAAAMRSEAIRGLSARGADGVVKLAMNIELCSKEFRDYVAANPKGNLVFSLSDRSVYHAIDMIEQVDEYSKYVYELVIFKSSPSKALITALQAGPITREQAGCILGKHGKAMDDWLADLPQIEQVQDVNEKTLGRKTTWLRLVK